MSAQQLPQKLDDFLGVRPHVIPGTLHPRYADVVSEELQSFRHIGAGPLLHITTVAGATWGLYPEHTLNIPKPLVRSVDLRVWNRSGAPIFDDYNEWDLSGILLAVESGFPPRWLDDKQHERTFRIQVRNAMGRAVAYRLPPQAFATFGNFGLTGQPMLDKFTLYGMPLKSMVVDHQNEAAYELMAAQMVGNTADFAAGNRESVLSSQLKTYLGEVLPGERQNWANEIDRYLDLADRGQEWTPDWFSPVSASDVLAWEGLFSRVNAMRWSPHIAGALKDRIPDGPYRKAELRDAMLAELGRSPESGATERRHSIYVDSAGGSRSARFVHTTSATSQTSHLLTKNFGFTKKGSSYVGLDQTDNPRTLRIAGVGDASYDLMRRYAANRTKQQGTVESEGGTTLRSLMSALIGLPAWPQASKDGRKTLWATGAICTRLGDDVHGRRAATLSSIKTGARIIWAWSQSGREPTGFYETKEALDETFDQGFTTGGLAHFDASPIATFMHQYDPHVLFVGHGVENAADAAANPDDYRPPGEVAVRNAPWHTIIVVNGRGLINTGQLPKTGPVYAEEFPYRPNRRWSKAAYDRSTALVLSEVETAAFAGADLDENLRLVDLDDTFRKLDEQSDALLRITTRGRQNGFVTIEGIEGFREFPVFVVENAKRSTSLGDVTNGALGLFIGASQNREWLAHRDGFVSAKGQAIVRNATRYASAVSAMYAATDDHSVSGEQSWVAAQRLAATHGYVLEIPENAPREAISSTTGKDAQVFFDGLHPGNLREIDNAVLEAPRHFSDNEALRSIQIETFEAVIGELYQGRPIVKVRFVHESARTTALEMLEDASVLHSSEIAVEVAQRVERNVGELPVEEGPEIIMVDGQEHVRVDPDTDPLASQLPEAIKAEMRAGNFPQLRPQLPDLY